MTIGILEQLRAARRHPLLAVFGGLLGGFPPLAAYWTTHGDLQRAAVSLRYVLGCVVAACLLFSVRTVWGWGKAAFREQMKAACLVVAIEGMMVASPSPWLAMLALAFLIGINAVATACTIAQEDAQPEIPNVTAVSRELSLPRKAAAKVVDQQLVRQPSQRARPA